MVADRVEKGLLREGSYGVATIYGQLEDERRGEEMMGGGKRGEEGLKVQHSKFNLNSKGVSLFVHHASW